jgi:L-fuconolactonase
LASEARASRIDAHQHFWRLSGGGYPWLKPTDHGPIYRDFGPEHLEPLLRASGVERTITVQADNSFSDTDAMLSHADRHRWIAAVIGWVPLLEPPAAARALDRYLTHPAFRGVRHLVHDEPDPDWLWQRRVVASLGVLEDRRLVFEIPAAFPQHLVHVPWLAKRFSDLTIVIDHLAKPPVASGELEPWATQLADAAARPNVYAKVSGLCTEADRDRWSAADLRPFVEVALECFGAERLMLGSDWPVCLLAGDYQRVWGETVSILDRLSSSARRALLGGTAARVYRLDE